MGEGAKLRMNEKRRVKEKKGGREWKRRNLIRRGCICKTHWKDEKCEALSHCEC